MAGDKLESTDTTTVKRQSNNCTTIKHREEAKGTQRMLVGYLYDWINAYSFISREYHRLARCCAVELSFVIFHEKQSTFPRFV